MEKETKEFINWLLQNESREGIKSMFYFCIDRKLMVSKLRELGYKLDIPRNLKNLIR